MPQKRRIDKRLIGEGNPTSILGTSREKDQPEDEQLELARAIASGDYRTVGEISLANSINYMNSEEARSPAGPRFDSNSAAKIRIDISNIK